MYKFTCFCWSPKQYSPFTEPTSFRADLNNFKFCIIQINTSQQWANRIVPFMISSSLSADVLPVTIKEIHLAQMANENGTWEINNVTFGHVHLSISFTQFLFTFLFQVTFVGHVLSIKHDPVDTTFLIDDFTGIIHTICNSDSEHFHCFQ